MASQRVATSSHGSTPATLPPDTPIVRPRELLLGGGSGSTVGHSTASSQGAFTTSQQINDPSTFWNESMVDDRDYNRSAFNAKQSLLNLSTQFRHWRFSFEHLNKIRADLNAVAVAALRDAGAGGDVSAPTYYHLLCPPLVFIRRSCLSTILLKGYLTLCSRVSALYFPNLTIKPNPFFSYRPDSDRGVLGICYQRQYERKSGECPIPDSSR